MTKGIISGFDFYEGFEAQKYWSFPSSYSKEKKAETLNQILYSGDYLAAEKKDGYWERFIKDDNGDVFMCSRNKGVNGVIEKYEWVPHLHSFFDWLPNGTCLIGEVYLPGKTSKNIVSILGCLKDKAIARQEKNEDKLKFYIFDILAYNGELLFNKPMEKRVEALGILNVAHDVSDINNGFIEFATYYKDPKIIHERWLDILAEGGEGMVLTHKDYPYSFKKKAARKTLKLKKELEETIDVFLTGRYKEPTYLYTGKEIENWEYWYDSLNNRKVKGFLSDFPVSDGFEPVTRLWYHGWAGAIEVAVMRDGKVLPIGHISNVPDNIKQGIVENNEEYKGKVVELQAMEIDRSNKIPTLRHAKIVKWRDDKNWIECDWSQLL